MNEVVQLKDIVNLRREIVQPNDSNKKLNFVGLKHIDSGVSTLKRWGDASEVKSVKSRFYPCNFISGQRIFPTFSIFGKGKDTCPVIY